MQPPNQITATPRILAFIAMLAWGVLGAAMNASAATSVSQYGITWTFSQDRPVGQFANGDWYVVGPVTLTNINPKTALPGSQESDTVGNGSMINPIPGQTQGLYRHGTDSEPQNDPKYVDSKNISLQLPYTVAPGNSVYSTVRNPDTWAPQPAFEGTWFRETAVLTVLSSAPPAGSFRPPYAGTDKTIKANWNVSSLNYSVLRNLPIPIPSNAPTMAWLEEATKRPLMEMNRNWINTNWKASWTNKPGGYPRRTYGREVAGVAGGAGLMLNTNLSNAQKEKLLIYMVQWGIDIHGLLKAGMEWQPNGGHNLGRLLPIYIAGKVLGDSEILAKASGSSPFQEMSNHSFVTQQIIDTPRSPSSPPRKPYTQDMLGMPEWSHGSPTDPNNSAAWSESGFYSSGYRFINGGPNTGTVATILLMGGRSEVNQEPFFRYHIERYYPKERASGNGSFSGNTNGIESFVRDMWDVYINGGVITPPPVEPPPLPTPVVFAVGDRIRVWRSTWVNSTASVTTPIGSQATDATGTIVEGPINTGADGIIWFRIDYDSGADGWSGADNFVKLSSVASKPTGLRVVK